jgi:hypothetical protein
MMRGLILAAAMAVVPWGVHAADAAPGIVTILEGDALVYRGSGRVHAAEGLKLALGDIVETGPSTFVQIEFADQSMVQFGGATRVLLQASTGRQKQPERALYVMQGWTKLAGVKREAASGPGFDLRTPLAEVAAGPGVVVMRNSPAELMLFVERGDARVTERPASNPPVIMPLRASDHYMRKAGTRGVVTPGEMRAFLETMPRSFRDSLPKRAERFQDQEVQAKEAPDFSYADVEVWLKAEPAVRRPLMQRWRAKAREPDFRAALISNLKSHPEWDPILFPEKYLPKPASAPSAPVAAASAIAR